MVVTPSPVIAPHTEKSTVQSLQLPVVEEKYPVSLSLSPKKKTAVESSAYEGLLNKFIEVRNITNNHFLYELVFIDTNTA